MKSHAETSHSDDSLLKETAVAIGGAAGTVAALAKSVFTPTPPPARRSRKITGRFVAKNKARLPRKEKKVLAKKALATRKTA